jgi:hypothetical protein
LIYIANTISIAPRSNDNGKAVAIYVIIEVGIACACFSF